jgi:hypothetical protein
LTFCTKKFQVAGTVVSSSEPVRRRCKRPGAPLATTRRDLPQRTGPRARRDRMDKHARNVVSSLRRRERSTGTERRLLELFKVRLHLDLWP